MIAKISGKIMSVVQDVTKKGKQYVKVQILQVQKDGVASLAVRFWDMKRVSSLQKDQVIEFEGHVGSFVSQMTGKALLSVDVW